MHYKMCQIPHPSTPPSPEPPCSDHFNHCEIQTRMTSLLPRLSLVGGASNCEFRLLLCCSAVATRWRRIRRALLGRTWPSSVRSLLINNDRSTSCQAAWLPSTPLTPLLTDRSCGESSALSPRQQHSRYIYTASITYTVLWYKYRVAYW